MNKNEYKAYLQSDYWNKLKRDKKILAKYVPRCIACGGWKYINLHHLNYERLGKELPSDTVWLCKDCHGWIHRMAIKMCCQFDYKFIITMRNKAGLQQLKKFKRGRNRTSER